MLQTERQAGLRAAASEAPHLDVIRRRLHKCGTTVLARGQLRVPALSAVVLWRTMLFPEERGEHVRIFNENKQETDPNNVNSNIISHRHVKTRQSK